MQVGLYTGLSSARQLHTPLKLPPPHSACATQRGAQIVHPMLPNQRHLWSGAPVAGLTLHAGLAQTSQAAAWAAPSAPCHLQTRVCQLCSGTCLGCARPPPPVATPQLWPPQPPQIWTDQLSQEPPGSAGDASTICAGSGDGEHL